MRLHLCIRSAGCIICPFLLCVGAVIGCEKVTSDSTKNSFWTMYDLSAGLHLMISVTCFASMCDVMDSGPQITWTKMHVIRHSIFVIAPVFNCLAAYLRVPICFDTLFILMSYLANCFYVLRGPALQQENTTSQIKDI